MGRILGHVAVAAAVVLAIGAGTAAADGFELPPEVVEPAVDPASVVAYPTALPALGELFAEPAVVTDDELVTVGAQPATQTTSSSPDFVVDDDLAQCPDADFTTATGIQQAVTAAPPESTIRVCPGLYSPVNVPKTLTLEAPIQHGQATRCQEAFPPDPTKDAIVDAGGTPVIGFNLLANNIVLSGFTVQNTQNNPGILTSPLFSGYEIEFNVVQRNSIGLYPNANGVFETHIHHNCFRLNNRVPAAAGGSGLYSDQGFVNAFIEHNTFVANPSASMILTLNQQDITVAHNTGDNTFVFVSTRDTVIEHNHLQMAVRSSGLFFGGAVTDTVARMNLIEDASTGINSNVQFLPTPNELVIEKNHVRGSSLDGVRLNQTDNSEVRGNKSERNGRDGVRLQNDSDMNLVESNLSRDNGRDGMRVDADGSNQNTIEANKMHANVEHDCHDDTVGMGTAGTANFWIKNIGKTENRPGLCKNATTT